jgi:hypothetical protein
MTDSQPGQSDDRREDPPASPQAGVLGNLPRTRPSVRSPRRADAPDPAADAARAAAASEPPREPSAPREPAAEQGNEIEALARTGIAAATGAATLGLRLAGRAAQAVRDAVERR